MSKITKRTLAADWDDVDEVLGDKDIIRGLSDRVILHALELSLALQEDDETWPIEQGLTAEEYLSALISEGCARTGFAPVGMAPGPQIYYGPAGHGLSCDCRACEVPTARRAS